MFTLLGNLFNYFVRFRLKNALMLAGDRSLFQVEFNLALGIVIRL